jgi:hypothetical protein
MISTTGEEIANIHPIGLIKQIVQHDQSPSGKRLLEIWDFSMKEVPSFIKRQLLAKNVRGFAETTHDIAKSGMFAHSVCVGVKIHA